MIVAVVRPMFIGGAAPQSGIDFRVTDPSADTAHQPLLSGGHQLDLPISVHLLLL
ncbi:hypothetical protein [Xanthobacter wiegelii]|uniref:hypothetical protein n=1 Tax=Xanthobacter wiegelii TaxID=3119913 RepID=UPI00372ABF49